MSSDAKISDHLQSVRASGEDVQLDVMIVLSAPKPDLSQVFGQSSPAKDSSTVSDREAVIDAAEKTVREILDQTGGEELRLFRNSASVLARVTTEGLDALAASDCVIEIVENQRLKGE